MFDLKKNLSIKILYVEDEDIVRESINEILKDFYMIDMASNGAEALELFKKNNYDLVITDITMPIMDGLELAKHIKELNFDTPIIITTAYNENKFLFKAIEVGVSNYVTKPVNMVNLVKIVEKTIEPFVLKREKIKREKEYQDKLIEQAKYAAIGQLAAGITHEINTPLTYMKASFELIEMDIEEIEDIKLKSSIESDLINIKDGFTRIENIIYSMRELFSSNTKEKNRINIYETLIISLNMAYNKSKHISNIYLNNKKFDFSLSKADEQYYAIVNASSIEQVWIILINNALDELVKVKDFDTRRLDIDINIENNFVKIIFKDNAGGINEDILPKIFEPFKSTKDSSGMGIGLNIAKKIVMSHNGEIKAYNLNEQAIFEILIPAE